MNSSSVTSIGFVNLSQTSIVNHFQDRRNRKSRTISMEIESLKDISGPSGAEKVKGSESHAPETTQG